MIEIECDVTIPAAHPTNINRLTTSLKNLMARYAEAYARVYGIRPTITWQNPWFKIGGSDARVSRARLLELTRQLEYRAG